MNMGTQANLQCIKVNAQLTKETTKEFQTLLKEFKDVFTTTYKDLKGIPPKLAQHIIELNTSIPLAHQGRYKLNPNYVATIKQDICKLSKARFIQPIKEATWLSPIMVAPKKNGKLRICVNFKKLNKAIKKNPYPLPFSNEVLNIVTRYEAYSLFQIPSNFYSP